jgi:methionyl-tRNA formyltransferase
MRIVFIGTVAFSLRMLEHLIAVGAEVVGVCTKQISSFNADFADLVPVCHRNDISYKYVDDINSPETLTWIRERKPDVIFCFGWSFLLKQGLLRLAPLGVVGYHPAALPANRGRHPLIWALALGLEKTASTFFFMDDGVDSGDIISQHEIVVNESDDAASLYAKVTRAALKQLDEFVPALSEGRHSRLKQPSELSNYWRKRTPADGLIDWRMSASAICNLVRALTRPYIGAEFSWQGTTIKVWRADCFDGVAANLEPGKVLAIENGAALIKCGEGVIRLLETSPGFTTSVGEYL